MIVGCYSLDLYCDAPGCSIYGPNSPHKRPVSDTFTGNNRSEATREARRGGWTVKHARAGGEGRAVCPSCRARR